MYLGNLYILGWAILFFLWLGGMFWAFNKSKPKNKVRNCAIIGVGGIVAVFLMASMNPARDVYHSRAMDFSAPEQLEEIPERIEVEEKLTDEQRERKLQELREKSKKRQEEEFSEFLPENAEESNSEEDNKGE